ncbi:MAG: FixH family protein [Bacteroidetes bacterium]|nr:FixH family protein [Bacteroidota bacterium]
MSNKVPTHWVITIPLLFVALIAGLVHIIYVGTDLFTPPVKDDFKKQQDFFQPESDRRATQEASGIALKMQLSSFEKGESTLQFAFSPRQELNPADTARFIVFRVNSVKTDSLHLVFPATDSSFVFKHNFTESGDWYIKAGIQLKNFYFRKEFRFTIR